MLARSLITLTSLTVLVLLGIYPTYGNVIYVAQDAIGDESGSDWSNACTSISIGLAASVLGDEVWVAAGQYLEAIEMKEGVALYGGFVGSERSREERDWAANETIIDATGLETHVVTGANNAILDGFTVTGGAANDGGGVYCNESSPILTNCTISGNTTHGRGGGLYCYGSSPTLTNCTISGNRSDWYESGGVYCNESSPTLINCTITENTADSGSGVYCRFSSATLTNCTIIGNQANGISGGGDGGGVYCYESSPMLIRCTITGNTANGFHGGGGVYCGWHSSPILTNCIISGNTARGTFIGGGGGGVYCVKESSPTLTNCTIARNRANGLNGGSGVCCESESYPMLTNCILWNYGDEIHGDLADSSTVTYSCIQGGWPGEGNIDTDPKFVSLTNDDYHLRNGSPCIDTGLVAAAPQEDMEGCVRLFGDGFVDMGAYESPDAFTPGDIPGPRIHYVRADATQGGDGSSWENAFTSIQATLYVSSANDEIWIASGNYNENIWMEPGVALYGGFEGNEQSRDTRDWTTNETIINASGLDTYAVVGANNAVLDGFTVTGGSAFYGSGVYCCSFSPTLIHCNITGNTAEEGGGVSFFFSSPTMTHCKITGNTGGGVFCFFSSPTLTNCTITGNTAHGGSGGVKCLTYSSPSLSHCTITGNTMSGEYDGSGGVYCENESYPTLTNCILWNYGDEIHGDSADSSTVTYSCVRGGWLGEGNIDADPLFADFTNGDFHPQKSSPCIDAGNPDASYDDACLPPGLGTFRCDMGAYGGALNCGWLKDEEPVCVKDWELW